MSRFPIWSKLASTTAAILILAAGCSEPAPTAVQLESSTVAAAKGSKANVVKAGKKFQAGTFSEVIGPQGGKIEFGIGEILFPAGAVDAPILITAKTDGETFTVDFGPDGTKFNAGAEPTLTYDLKYYTGSLDGLQILHVDGEGNVIEGVTTFADLGGRTISGMVKHFSKYALATS